MADPSFELIQPHRQPLFDLSGFDRAISAEPGGKGVQLVHYRAMPCPAGLDSPYDQRRPHERHDGCSGGFIYRPAGNISALFTGNSVQQRQTDPGLLAASTASITLSRFYQASDPIDPEQVRVCQFDRLFLADDSVLVETWELFQHEPILDRLRFPVVKVVDLVSASGKRFGVGDFTIRADGLEWVGARPRIRPDGRGEVCSVRYLYRPYWYVTYVHHDLRLVTQDHVTEGGVTNRTVAVYQACQVQREHFYRTEDRDPLAPDPTSSRQVDPPKEPPQFGPR